MHINEVPKFLAESPSVNNHALELTDPFDADHLLIIPLKLSSVTSYFDVYSPRIAEYENEDIPKIHLTTEEPPWDPSTNEYSESKACMLNHIGQISILSQWQGDQYLSAQLFHTHWLMMLLMLWMMIILQLHSQPRFRSP